MNDNNRRIMKEEYMLVDEQDAEKFRCPCPIIASDKKKCRLFCDGYSCMAWIMEVDDDGVPTGSGRCGMVAAILPRFPLYTCTMPTSEPEPEPEENR